ncbi:MAG: alkyl hydroperoxide reductase [Paenibacillaceae bacterium ZCTH02-B3]|nr:MAG: alkyl hydroperoxide reductase [Paenibacillaceae bacterium ZCTH02-B3]
MAATPSNMIPLGTVAGDFALTDAVSGKTMSLSELKSDVATVIVFMCNHCPYVRHIIDQLVQTANDYIPKGVRFVAINSNDAEQYPEDSPEEMKKWAGEKRFPFPYLFDATQEVAKAYGAACTPDFFVFDGNLRLVYRGQFDGSRPGSGVPVTGSDLRAALDCLLEGRPVPADQKPSLGCNIKWKKGA